MGRGEVGRRQGEGRGGEGRSGVERRGEMSSIQYRRTESLYSNNEAHMWSVPHL